MVNILFRILTEVAIKSLTQSVSVFFECFLTDRQEKM